MSERAAGVSARWGRKDVERETVGEERVWGTRGLRRDIKVREAKVRPGRQIARFFVSIEKERGEYVLVHRPQRRMTRGTKGVMGTRRVVPEAPNRIAMKRIG